MSRRRDEADPLGVAIREEFAFHIAACAAELEAEGWPADAARDEASRRFGPPEPFEDACRREAPEETMGTKSTIALTAGLALVAASIGFLAVATARQGAALARIETQLATTAAAEAAATKAALSAHADATPGLIYIDGAVQRPGVYELPPGLTLSRLVTAAGVEPVDLRVLVMPKVDGEARLAAWRQAGGAVDTRDGEACMVVERKAEAGMSHHDPALRDGDKVWIAMR